jgi:DNA-3-methyladenine glycosylase
MIFEESESRLGRDFFMTDAVDLAKKLLGKKIVRIIECKKIICRIVEAEAYMAPEDKGSHAYNNRKTKRTSNLWKNGGFLYVCSVYGNTYCMNIVANDDKKPQAVLIRAVEPIKGLSTIIENRKNIYKSKKVSLSFLTNGPGKLTAALKIDRSFNGVDLCSSKEIFLIDDDNDKYSFEMGMSKRINIDYADEWKDKPWRFFIKKNLFVSKVKSNYLRI